MHPANMLQNSVDLEAMEEICMEGEVPSAFDNDDFFDQKVPNLLEKLPVPLDFLLTHGHDPLVQESSHVVCGGMDCLESFQYECDWRAHMINCGCSSFKCP
jgi:hypothetical protein